MKIAFISTRGVPNNYGGLEEFAEHVSVSLVKRGHEVIVYCPHFHPYLKEVFHGVRIKKKYSPEKNLGTAANFIYDFLSFTDAIKNESCDVVLVCGYTTAAVSFLLYPFGRSKIITNIDGLEWQRVKYSPMIQRLTRWFEKIAVQKSHAVISDNAGIEEYVWRVYNKSSFFIPYAAHPLQLPDEKVLQQFGLEKFKYHLLIGRLEPENNIEMLLDGVEQSSSEIKTYVFAGLNTKFAKYISDKHHNSRKIVFKGWVSGQETLNQLRHFSRIYFHGHSVGGTNPSLLEAMAGGAFISAHNNVFNKNVLGNDALYFSSASEVKNIIDGFDTLSAQGELFRKNNLQKIISFYNWTNITDLYEKMFFSVTGKK